MKPIPNWRRAPRMLSVQVAAIAVVFGGMPVETQAAILGLIGIPMERVSAVIGLVFIFGRLVSQSSVQEKEE